MSAPEPESGAVPAARDAEGGVAATAPVPPAPDPKAAPEGRLSLATRLSDRLNPILVRETQQAVNGKTFLAALVLALVSIVLVALSTAGTGRSTRADGWAAFVLGMQVLTPILCLVVPLQAFLSTRHEVSGGTVEHLLLSRLTPGAVVRGKVTASVVESLVFLSVFAPLIALTYLLRGVDVPTIAVALGLAFTYGVGATVFAVAMGAVCRWPGLRALPLVIVALGLTIGTGLLTVGMREALREVTFVLRRTDIGFGHGFSILAMPVLVTAPFLFLVASAALAHPYENRSTAFRIFALVGVLGMAAWYAWGWSRGVPWGTMPAAHHVPRFLAVTALLSFPFWMFAATEEEPLSPRVRTLVPKRALLAAAAVPFLPGGGRGLLFTLLLAACAILSAVYLPLLFGGATGETDGVWLAVKAWGYVLLYASLAKLLRNLMPAGGRATALLRVGFPAVVAFLALLPAVLRLLAGTTSSEAPLSGLNPFATLAGSHWEGDWVVVAGPLALLFHIGSMVEGAREVAVASKARRDRAA